MTARPHSVTRRIVVAALVVSALGIGASVLSSFGVATPNVYETPVAWTNQFGTSATDDSRVLARAANGDLLVAGGTYGAFPGFANAGLGYDIFVARFDKNGVRRWVRQFGSPDPDLPLGIVVSSAGDAFVTGVTLGDLDGTGAGQHFGQADAFVARLDKNGVVKWIRQRGTTSYDNAKGIALAGSDLYLVGTTEGDIDGTGPGALNGPRDAFVARFDTNGNEKWIRQFGSADFDSATAVAVRGTSEIYVVGETSGDLDGPGPLVQSGEPDGFLMRFDKTGSTAWMRQFGGSYMESLQVAVSGSSSVTVVGTVEGEFDGPGPGPFGGFDGAVLRFDKNGTEIWRRQFGGSESDFADDVAVNSAGVVFIVGATQNDLDNAGPGQVVGGTDAFVLTMSNTGATVASRLLGTPAADVGFEIVLSSAGKPIVVGTTNGAIWGHPNLGDRDAFLAQLP